MDNPCKECIVNMMCNKQCENLIRYIIVRTDYSDFSFQNQPKVVAYWMRMSKIIPTLVEAQITFYKSFLDSLHLIIRDGGIIKANKKRQTVIIPMKKGLIYYKAIETNTTIYCGFRERIPNEHPFNGYMSGNGGVILFKAIP